MELQELRNMSLPELAEYITEHEGEFTDAERLDLHDVLGNQMEWIGRLWDKVDNVDPRKGNQGGYGTPNHRSMTYKCRKLGGFSYP